MSAKVINNHEIATPIDVISSSTPIYAQAEQELELFIRPQMLSVKKCKCENPANPAFYVKQPSH